MSSWLRVMAKFKLAIQGKTREFEIFREGNTLRIRDGAKTAVLHLIHTGEQTLLLEQEYPNGRRRQIRVAGVKNGDKRALWVNGRSFSAERVRERGTAAAAADSSLAATIPAVVTEILVDVGAEVAAGDRLILLESMKMVIPIQAPYDGVITAIHCAPGESVQAGVQLVELKET